MFLFGKYFNYWQGFWNLEVILLLENNRFLKFLKINSKIIKSFVIFVDTIFLWLSVVIFRIQKFGLQSRIWAFLLFTPHEALPVLWFDIGLHRHGKEMFYMYNYLIKKGWGNSSFYGFEANPSSFSALNENCLLDEYANRRISLIQAAVVGSDEKEVKLYLDHFSGDNKGIGDSVVLRRTKNFINVPAIRLSDFLVENDINIDEAIVFLRMNIEGSEQDVLHDLSKSSMLHKVDGFFGMWDDLYKSHPDPSKDKDFVKFMVDKRIFHVTLNNRDFRSKARLNAIKYHFRSCICLGARRKSLGPF